MSYILHICFIGWLGGCSSISDTEFMTKAECEKVLTTVERQIKETKRQYIAYCRQVKP